MPKPHLIIILENPPARNVGYLPTGDIIRNNCQQRKKKQIDQKHQSKLIFVC